MRKLNRFFMIACLFILLCQTTGLAESGDISFFSYGKLLSIEGNQLTLEEYDEAAGTFVKVTYQLGAKLNIASIQVGQTLDIVYKDNGDSKVIYKFQAFSINNSTI